MHDVFLCRGEGYRLARMFEVVCRENIVDFQAIAPKIQGCIVDYPPQPEWLETLADYSRGRRELFLSISAKQVRFSNPAFYAAMCAGMQGNLLAVEMFFFGRE